MRNCVCALPDNRVLAMRKVQKLFADAATGVAYLEVACTSRQVKLLESAKACHEGRQPSFQFLVWVYAVLYFFASREFVFAITNMTLYPSRVEIAKIAEKRYLAKISVGVSVRNS
jgi:hypothetical protein